MPWFIFKYPNIDTRNISFRILLVYCTQLWLYKFIYTNSRVIFFPIVKPFVYFFVNYLQLLLNWHIFFGSFGIFSGITSCLARNLKNGSREALNVQFSLCANRITFQTINRFLFLPVTWIENNFSAWIYGHSPMLGCCNFRQILASRSSFWKSNLRKKEQ